MSLSEFTQTLHEIAEKSIPKSKLTSKQLPKPWFTDGCKTAIADRKKALNIFKKQPTSTNLDTFKMLRAKARRVIREEKSQSWCTFVSGLNSRISVKKAWDMVRKISGKTSAMAVKHLSVNNNKITDVRDICNALASTISENSSNNHYSLTFQQHKTHIESRPLNFKSKTRNITTHHSQ